MFITKENISTAVNDNSPHKESDKFVAHLEAMLTHAANKVHLPGNASPIFQGHMEEHLFVNEKFHEQLVKVLEELAEHHAVIAKHFAEHLLEKCNRVLANSEHAEHHKHAQTLQAIVQERHDAIENTIIRNERDAEDFSTDVSIFYTAKARDSRQFIENTHRRILSHVSVAA